MRLVLTLCAFTGLRKGDALTLTKAAYNAESGWIAANTAKNGRKVQWPVIAPLRAILDAAPAHDAISPLPPPPKAARGPSQALTPHGSGCGRAWKPQARSDLA